MLFGGSIPDPANGTVPINENLTFQHPAEAGHPEQWIPQCCSLFLWLSGVLWGISLVSEKQTQGLAAAFPPSSPERSLHLMAPKNTFGLIVLHLKAFIPSLKNCSLA